MEFRSNSAPDNGEAAGSGWRINHGPDRKGRLFFLYVIIHTIISHTVWLGRMNWAFKKKELVNESITFEALSVVPADFH